MSPHAPLELRDLVALAKYLTAARVTASTADPECSRASLDPRPPSGPQPPPRSRSQHLAANHEDRARGFVHDSLAHASQSAQPAETTAWPSRSERPGWPRVAFSTIPPSVAFEILPRAPRVHVQIVGLADRPAVCRRDPRNDHVFDLRHRRVPGLASVLARITASPARAYPNSIW